jgi:ribosome-associated protein
MALDFTITKGDYIELIRLLKVMNLASSGSEAKILVDEGFIYLNGVRESRRRAKVKSGDKVELRSDEENVIIRIK